MITGWHWPHDEGVQAPQCYPSLRAKLKSVKLFLSSLPSEINLRAQLLLNHYVEERRSFARGRWAGQATLLASHHSLATCKEWVIELIINDERTKRWKSFFYVSSPANAFACADKQAKLRIDWNLNHRRWWIAEFVADSNSAGFSRINYYNVIN